MKQTLIKLSDTHYIVVDDSEIKDKEPFLDMRDYPDVYDEDIYWAGSGGSSEFANTIGKKIIYSFGIELKGTINKPLAEVEEAIYGYSVEKMARDAENLEYSDVDPLDSCGYPGLDFNIGYQKDFNAHKELVKDKLFTVEDMKKAYYKGAAECHDKTTIRNWRGGGGG